MKYKVGDKVRIKDSLKPGEYGVTSFMLGYCGKVMTVKSTYSILSAYYLVEDNAEFIWYEDILEPADSKTLRMADGTIIGDFNTGGMVNIHDLPTSEWYNPMRLTFKNGSSIETLPQKDDTVRGENHFCTGFRGGKIPALSEIKGFAAPSLDLSVFSNNGISAKNGGKNSMKFTFYVKEGTRPDKKCNGTIPTITTNIELFDGNVFDYVTSIRGSATCDKADYDERQGVLEALANAVCGGEFEKRYSRAVKANKDADLIMRTCTYCGKVCDTSEEKIEHEKWHVERKKARRERYLLRKRAKEIAFEEQAQKMAKEMMK